MIFRKSRKEFGTKDVARASSFPFLSGDTFRLLSSHAINGAGEVCSLPGQSHVCFAEADALHLPHVFELLERIGVTERTDGKKILIIHNGDKLPPPITLSSLSSENWSVFSVNAQDGIPGVTPIPIGLENSWLQRNGEISRFLSCNPIGAEREISILASFATRTNREIREPLRKRVVESGHRFVEPKLSLEEYRSYVLRSKFVLCPPGNGPDTHRTWEALYWGAIPVVLKDSLAESLWTSLPIVAVESFDEILEMGYDQRDELFRSMQTVSTDFAYAPAWISRILS